MRRVALLVVLALSIGAVWAPSASAVTPKTALLYGDSLTWESTSAITNHFKLKPGWTFHPHSYPGTAPCVWLDWIDADLAAFHPSVVGIETAGNYLSPCMNGATLNSAEMYAKYRADLSTFFSKITATGAKVVFIVSPPWQNTAQNTAINQIRSIATELAAQYHGVSIATGPRNQVSASGRYVAAKKCLVSELTNPSCGQAGTGMIYVRTVVGIQAGVHLCPDGLDTLFPFRCLSTYSSGELRFGRAIANTLVAPPPPVLP